MLHPHQYRALLKALQDDKWNGKSADEVYNSLSDTVTLKNLGRTRFLTQDQLEALPQKQRPTNVVVITSTEQCLFPSGVPGFPNKLSRQCFDRAWSEGRG